jgi:hypothetical protein
MPSVGFETAVPASYRLEIYALDGAATGIGQQLDWPDCIYGPVQDNQNFK